jgi:Ala-tRNA(Pro) deacylase
MTMLPADHRADLQKLEKIAGEPASLETEEEFESLFPNCAEGAMRPFGNLYGLPTCVDKRLTQGDYIVFEAGTHTDAIKLNDRGYEQIVKPRVEDLAIKVLPIQRA